MNNLNFDKQHVKTLNGFDSKTLKWCSRYVVTPITFMGIAALVVSGGHYTVICQRETDTH